MNYKTLTKIINKAFYFGKTQLEWIKNHNNRFCQIIDIDYYKYYKVINKIIDMYFYDNEVIDNIYEKVNKILKA